MSKRLSEIAITHISLVKAGANGKSLIYKSGDQSPSYEKTIDIKKSDNERDKNLQRSKSCQRD